MLQADVMWESLCWYRGSENPIFRWGNSWAKPFPLLTWISQIFCYTNLELTNKPWIFHTLDTTQGFSELPFWGMKTITIKNGKVQTRQMSSHLESQLFWVSLNPLSSTYCYYWMMIKSYLWILQLNLQLNMYFKNYLHAFIVAVYFPQVFI